LLTSDGTLLPRAEIEKKLADLGATKDTSIVAYCTGGVRLGWFTTVLNDLGFKARETTPGRRGNGRRNPRRSIRWSRIERRGTPPVPLPPRRPQTTR
jgi:hypothetical protein